MRNFFLAVLIFSLINSSWALQIKNVVDNETTTAKISSIDVTRIFVQGDRIQSVKGLKGAYTRENDEKNGEIYLQPSALYQNRAFTILIETERGRHFTLLLNPTSSPSETLMLVPHGVGQESALHFEEALAYELTMNRLIKAMKNGLIPEGYRIHQVSHKKTYQFERGLKAQLKTIYEGFHFRGEVYEIKNSQIQPITLDERQFYKIGTRAISLDATVIKPNEKLNLYRVVNHG